MDCYCDDDPPEFWSSKIKTARKQHRCGECGKPIKPGDKYEAVAAVQAGDFYAPKTCEPCHDLRQWVANNLPCFCWAHGNVLDDAKAAVSEATHRATDETRGL